MKALRAVGLEKLLLAIVATAPALVALAACGGAVEGADPGGGVDSTQRQGCGGGRRPPEYVPYLPPRCGPPENADAAENAENASDAGASGLDGSASDASALDGSASDASALDGSLDPDAAPGDAGDGGLVCETMTQYCGRVCNQRPIGDGYEGCTIDLDKGQVVCQPTFRPCGRAHEGLAPMAASSHVSEVAQWLASAAYLEDASVASFEILARELELHDAPRALVIAARRSARDEVRHTRVMSALAQRHGGRAPRAAKPRRELRGLREMLLENAVEGCVNETYGALLAWYQAEHAADPKIRAAMRRIALDETRHAALARAVAVWAESRIDEETRASIRAARSRALSDLAATLDAEPDAALADVVGLPSATIARGMLHALAGALHLAA